MKQKLIRIANIIIISTACLIAGCSTMRGPNGYAAKNNRPTLSADAYLQLAATAQGEQQQIYYLQAANRYIQNRQPINAQQVLYRVPNSNLPALLLNKKQILQANIWILQNQNQWAISLLQKVVGNSPNLNINDRRAVYQLLGYAYQKTGNLPASIQQRTALLAISKQQPAKEQVLMSIWRSVQNEPLSDLQQLKTQTSNTNVEGWIDLAVDTKQYANSNAQLTGALQQWKNNFPNHPANQLLPGDLRNQVAVAAQPKQVALLLPLTGAYAGQAKAIRNGFLAAYYYAKRHRKDVPSVIVLNTTGKSIQQVYSNAIQRGAGFVVGPLTKQNVQTLAQSTNIAVPTLALNSVANPKLANIQHLYQFGLSPLAEVPQIVQKAMSDHHSHALIIAPSAAWGQQIAQAFTKQWQAAGGRVVGELNYSDTAKLGNQVRNLMNVNLSEQRARNIRRILREKVRFVPRRRKDADMIFLVAQPRVARLIKPILRYYYAGSLPVYSTSQIFNGVANNSHDRDLNGIIFPDMPWVLKANHLQPKYLDQIQNRIKSLWPKSYRQHAKLYALGVDAFDVISRLNNMAMLPSIGTEAATGMLFLEPNHHINRSLLWAQMIDGRPKPIQ